MNIVIWIIAGIVSGWIAGEVMQGHGYGLIGDLVLGLLGGVIGGWLAGMLGLSVSGLLGSILLAAAGAVVLVVFVRLLRRI
jgi:uncharacterized membrane protein YeaQ/YmgE (transglycosylase-associated protein family)